jgi:hypothetical protein
MPEFICVTCGTQYADRPGPPEHCAICSEERQYIGWQGQRWTTLAELRSGHQNRLESEGPGLVGVGTDPRFAIGQRALHVRTSDGSGFLWDCISLVDDATVAAVQSLGRVTGIAISHPHYYSSMVEWSRALGGVPVYLHEADAQWVMRHDPVIRFWGGETLEPAPGITLVRCGGHFAGGTVLHWADGADGAGALLTGDILMVGEDRRTTGFMYSYPNYIPLNARAVQRIGAVLEPFEFDHVYGGWFGRNILAGGKQAVRYSVRRYLHAISERTDS